MKGTIAKFLLISMSLIGFGRGGEFTVNVFHDALFNQPNPVQEMDVVFPADGRLYASVEVILTLEPPTGLDGDEWDRMGHIFMYDDRGEWLEIARLITPFWNPPWTWTLDITELQLLFHGERKIGVWLQSWKDDGYQVSVSFRFTEGTPPLVPVKITNMWNGAAWGYGNEGNTQMEQFFDPLSIPIGDPVDQVLSRISVTGHRFVDNSENAAEFLRRNRTLRVNGGGDWVNELWQECGDWEVQPQDPGTWFFDRSGWCPGDLVDPWIVDITPQITPGGDATVEYIPDVYVNTGTARDAMEQIGSQLIEMRQSNGFLAVPRDDFTHHALSDADLNGIGPTYNLHNFNGASIDTTATANVPWLTLNPAAASLAPGETAQVTALLNNAAENLTSGSYQATITLTDTSNGVSEQRQLSLLIKDKLLVAHWKLDETSGTVATDASGNGHTGMLEGGVNFADHGEPGIAGNGLAFDGIDDLINAGPVPIEGPFSIAAWVQPRDITSGSGFAYKWHDSGRTFWFGQSGTDGFLRFGIYPSIFQRNLSSTAAVITDNDWTHVVATYDGHFQKIFVDGALEVTSIDRNEALRTQAGDLILARGGNSAYFNGVLDDLRLYNYDLDVDQVHRLYCPADLNGDDAIDATDVPLAYDLWPNGPDLNYDDHPNILDILVLGESFGSCP